jgi:hypothetical protein
MALLRFVDGDEGVYAYAARLAVHGYVPYRDFFYEQTPLMPYVYGAWSAVTGESWPAVRLLSVAISIGVGALLFEHLRRRVGLTPALSALLVYVGSGLVFGYFTIVKTFALSSLLIFGAYALAASGRAWPVAGALLGLAVDTRLLLAAVLPVFAVAAFRARRLLGLTAGFAAAATPVLVLLALYPDAFFFDNVRYHSLKSPHGLVGNLHEKLQTAATLLGLEPTDRALGLQFALLVLAGVAALAWPRVRRAIPLALAIALSLGLVSFLPTPTYVQYFSLIVPFLAVAAAELAALAPRLLLAGCLVAYLVPAIWAANRFTGHDPLLRPSISSVEDVARRVDSIASPRERVLSSWPGYLFGTHARALQDYTNQFAPVAAAKIRPSQARRFHVAAEAELERRIREREVAVVVYRNWVTSPPFAHWDAALRAGGYHLVATVQTARIYTH